MASSILININGINEGKLCEQYRINIMKKTNLLYCIIFSMLWIMIFLSPLEADVINKKSVSIYHDENILFMSNGWNEIVIHDFTKNISSLLTLPFIDIDVKRLDVGSYVIVCKNSDEVKFYSLDVKNNIFNPLCSIKGELQCFDMVDIYKIYYMNQYSELVCYDIKKMKKIIISKLGQVFDIHWYNEFLYVIFTNGVVHVYNKELNKKDTFRLNMFDENIALVVWGEKGVIQYQSKGKMSRLYDIKNQQLVNRLDGHYGSPFAFFENTISYSGDTQRVSVFTKRGSRVTVVDLGEYKFAPIEVYENKLIINNNGTYVLNLANNTKLKMNSFYRLGKFNVEILVNDIRKEYFDISANIEIDEMKVFQLPSSFYALLANFFKNKDKINKDELLTSDFYLMIDKNLNKIYLNTSDYYIMPNSGYRNNPNNYILSNGMFVAVNPDSDLWGFVTKKGEPGIGFKYNFALPFSEGLAVVVRNNIFSFIDINENLILSGYTFATSFKEGLAFVEKDMVRGYINKKGDFVFLCEEPGTGFSDGLCLLYNSEYIDVHGKIIYDLNRMDLRGKSFHDGFAPVQNNEGKWGYIDRNFQVVISFIYDDAEPFYNGHAAVKIDGKWGYINEENKLIIKPLYDVVTSYNSGYAVGIMSYVVENGGQYFTSDIYYCDTIIGKYNNKLGQFSEGVFLVW